MPVTEVLKQLDLCALQGLGPGDRLVLKLFVELDHEHGARAVIHLPQGAEGAPRSGLDGNTRKPQRRPIVARRRIAGTQREKLERGYAQWIEELKREAYIDIKGS